MIFIESKAFTKSAQELLSDYELMDLQERLLQNTMLGDLIPGTGGLRKLRVSLRSRSKGKRGGARVIYYFLARTENIHLLLLYPKGRQDDLTPEQKKLLRQLVVELENS